MYMCRHEVVSVMKQEHFQLLFDLEASHWWFKARRNIISNLIFHLVPPSQDTTILEVGCGTGGNLLELSQHYHVAGCDISAEAISFAKQKLPDIDLVVGSAPDDVERDLNGAKVVLLLDVIEHVKDDKRLVVNLIAGMKPSSFLIVTAPADRKLWSPQDEAVGHVRRYELTDFNSLTDGLPVECLLTSYFCSRLYPIIRVVRAINNLQGKASGQNGTDFWMPTTLINDGLTNVFAGELMALKRKMRSCESAFRFGSSIIGIWQV